MSIQPESSPTDKRNYLYYTLPSNKLPLLLISDPTTEKSSCSVDVRVGHQSDPTAVPGLAHFLEHMLFMGTEKYPDENDFSAFLNAHGGKSNAHTGLESTTYYFSVTTDHFEGAMDRFAQFFTNPLFTSSATEREMKAVDSENAGNHQTDEWRHFQLVKSLCHPSHPFSKFGTGNLVTLRDEPAAAGTDVREELLKFHERYYDTNVMRLVVLGRESLDDLKALAEKYFSNVADKSLTNPVFPGRPFGDNELRKEIRVVPVQEVRSVELNFPMREVQSLYKEKPTNYISHLLGHEGKGSILAFLKQMGWANELCAGEDQSASDWSMFSVSIELTEAGLEHVYDVVEVVFAYIKLMQDEGPQEWVHEEMKSVADSQFQFLSKREPIDYTCQLASNMQIYDKEHIISGPYKIRNYNPLLITECLSYLKPSNLLLFITSKSFEGQTNLKEKWYGTDYSLTDISNDLLSQWEKATPTAPLLKSSLHYPERNTMIATDFSLRHSSSSANLPKDHPLLLTDSPTLRLWYKPDNVFDMPKLNVMSVLQTPVVFDSPGSVVASVVWLHVLREQTVDVSYAASMANLNCSFNNARTGIEVFVSGYNQKLNVLLKKIVDAMAKVTDDLEEDLFERMKEKTSKQYISLLCSAPYQHAFNALDLCIETPKYSIQDIIASFDNFTIQDLVSFNRRLLSRFRLEVLVHGNATPAEAKALADILLTGLKPTPPLSSQPNTVRALALKAPMTIYRFREYNPAESNSCLTNTYQIGRLSLHQLATLALLHRVIQEPAFNVLRTEEQLGYIVHTAVHTNAEDIKGFMILIQSDTRDPVFLNQRVENFMENHVRRVVAGLSQEEFGDVVNGLAKTYKEANHNLGEETTKYWSAISNKSYLFKKHHLIAQELETSVTQQDLLMFYDKYFAKQSPYYRLLSVQVFGKDHAMEEEVGVEGKEDGVEVIRTEEELAEFKRVHSFFPMRKKVDVESMRFVEESKEKE